MYDKELIEKLYDLTCDSKDVDINQEDIKYDIEHPFAKYYSIEVIENAVAKYVNHEWTSFVLDRWATLYCWVLSGGFDDNLIEELNPLQALIKEHITDLLDVLSSFDEEKVQIKELLGLVEQFKNLDIIYKTSNDWRGYAAVIGMFGLLNGDKYIVLINDSRKEYLITIYNFYDEEYLPIFIENVGEDEFKMKIQELEQKEFRILSFRENIYYEEIK